MFIYILATVGVATLSSLGMIAIWFIILRIKEERDRLTNLYEIAVNCPSCHVYNTGYFNGRWRRSDPKYCSNCGADLTKEK